MRRVTSKHWMRKLEKGESDIGRNTGKLKLEQKTKSLARQRSHRREKRRENKRD